MGAQGGEESVGGIVGVAGDGDLRVIFLLQAGDVFLISRGLSENINILCLVKTSIIALIHVQLLCLSGSKKYY